MTKTVAYIRVSSKDQNLDRQLAVLNALGIEEKYIYQDKQSGKDFERVGYMYMKKSLEPGDTLVIKELDRLGRNQMELKKEWEYFRDNEINVRVLDMPALNINYDDENIKPLVKMINNIIFEIMSWKAENERETIKKRQAEGIATAKANNVKFGRPKTKIPDNFIGICTRWRNGEITATDAIILTGMKRTNFYKQVKSLNL
ncbi:MAG: recombinase family protein [Clostridia bacterium]|nr:recombinase family protein [Clostridia bacterium]